MSNQSEVKVTTIDPFNMQPGMEAERARNRAKRLENRRFAVAVAAMQGFVANPLVVEQTWEVAKEETEASHKDDPAAMNAKAFNILAAQAVIMADELLRELESPSER